MLLCNVSINVTADRQYVLLSHPENTAGPTYLTNCLNVYDFSQHKYMLHFPASHPQRPFLLYSSSYQEY